jgi:ParB-like chromosome segregation protein Spo0J
MKIRDIAVGRKDMFMIDPKILKVKSGWNARIAGVDLDEHIQGLKNSIKEIGVQQPLTIFMEGDEVFVTDGHCRLQATLLAIEEGAEIAAVPCKPEERYSNEADRVLSMVIRNSGKPLTMLEQADVVKRLLSFGWEAKTVAQKTGYSGQHVANLIVLAGADEQMRSQIAKSMISASLAVDLLKHHGDDAGELVSNVIEETGKKFTKKHQAVAGDDGGETPLEKAHRVMREKRAAGEVERLSPVEKAKQNPKSMRLAINANCSTCVESRKDITNCNMVDGCPFWYLRPYQREDVNAEILQKGKEPVAGSSFGIDDLDFSGDVAGGDESDE